MIAPSNRSAGWAVQARTTQLAPASPARPSLSAARRKRRSVCCSAGPSSGDGSQDAQGGGGESGGGGDEGRHNPSPEGEEVLANLAARREQAARLNAIFFGADAQGVSDLEVPAAEQGGGEAEDAALDGELVLRDLPLWRVQWSELMGDFSVMHVHVPHYTSMFNRLMLSPQPWRFGSLFLPEGSRNLGSPEFALEPGSKAPLAGTLMEVLQAVRFADGRLLILAMGIARFRVARPLQTVPYSRADVELLIDAEEQQAFEGLALQALESVAGGGAGADVPLSALMSAVPAAARAAAAAYNSAWVDYELSDARQDGGTGGTGGVPVLDGSDPREAQKMGRRLASIAGNEVLQLPFYEALLSAAQAAAAPGMADLLASGEDASSVLQAAVDAQRPVLRQTEAAAWALATSAAARAIGQQLQRLQASGGSGGDSSGGSGGGPGADTAGAAAATGPCLNTASERGVETQSPAEVLGEDALDGEPDSLAVALRLEAALWQEIDAVHALASKLRERVQPLPSGIACLRPMAQQRGQQEEQQGGAGAGPQPAAAAAAGEAADAAAVVGAHPDYPALRRVQRLSHAATAMLANVSQTEGRQGWIECGSICARLRLSLASLRKHRQVLAAVCALEGL